MELARQLRAKREERGLSQDEVAKAIFVSRQTISNWETDKTYPDMQSLLLLSQLFDTSIDELVKGDADRQRGFAQDEALVIWDGRLFGASFPLSAGLLDRLARAFRFRTHEQGQHSRRNHVHRALRYRVRYGHRHRSLEEEA